MSDELKRRRLWRRPTYRVWSIKTITIVALFVVVLTATSVFVFGKRSLFAETELTLVIIAAGLFLFLSVGLYRGIRVRRRDLPGIAASETPLKNVMDGMDPLSTSFEVAGAADDILSAIGGFIVALIGLIVLGVVLWILLSLGVVVWVFLLAALAWVFHRALRVVFSKSRVCRGNLAKSLAYALMYTLLYTGWLFALVIVAEAVFGDRLAAR
jgi:hypothetical protein